MEYFRQCTMRKQLDSTEGECHLNHVSWIPEPYAHSGNYIQLKKYDGTWEDGWKIIDVGARVTLNECLERSQDYKHQRKASDI